MLLCLYSMVVVYRIGGFYIGEGSCCDGLWHRVALWGDTIASEEHIASIFGVEIETVCSFETLVLASHTTQFHNPEDRVCCTVWLLVLYKFIVCISVWNYGSQMKQITANFTHNQLFQLGYFMLHCSIRPSFDFQLIQGAVGGYYEHGHEPLVSIIILQ